MEQDFQQFLLDSGYQNIGDYGPGLEITARNQIFWRDGELYRAGASLELPYTTTGDWGDEEGLFVAVGDAALRQELANPDKGSGRVARGGVAVDSIADLLAMPESARREDLRYLVKGYYSGSALGGGEFFWDSEKPKNMHDGGMVISQTVPFSQDLLGFITGVGESDISGHGCFVRVVHEEILLQHYGVVSEQDSAAFNTAMSHALTAIRPGQTLSVEKDITIELPEGFVFEGDLSGVNIDFSGLTVNAN